MNENLNLKRVKNLNTVQYIEININIYISRYVYCEYIFFIS